MSFHNRSLLVCSYGKVLNVARLILSERVVCVMEDFIRMLELSITLNSGLKRCRWCLFWCGVMHGSVSGCCQLCPLFVVDSIQRCY